MTYYLMIENNKILGASQCTSGGDIIDVEVSEEVYNAYIEDNLRYIWNGEEIIENPNYEAEKAAKEKTVIDSLTMTALDFINFLKQSGITDSQIEAYLNTNLDVKHRLQFCQNVYCGVAKALMPISVGNLTITAEMVESAFKVKNGMSE